MFERMYMWDCMYMFERMYMWDCMYMFERMYMRGDMYCGWSRGGWLGLT
jgi:hypothetical protein